MKQFLSLIAGAVLGALIVLAAMFLLQGRCCHAHQRCCPPPPCRWSQKCHAGKKCHISKPCPEKKDCARRPHPGMTEAKKQWQQKMQTLRTLREKYPDEMLAIDKEFVAAEDKIAALAAKDGLEMPKPHWDFRRIRIAFPEEMKTLDAQKLAPREYFEAVKKLAEKMKK